MNEQDTPLPGCVGSGQKLLHSDFGLFHGVAMQVDMRLDRIIATVQALRQTSIDPWGNAFHILIRVLNRKLPAPFDEVPQVSQGFVVVSSDRAALASVMAASPPGPVGLWATVSHRPSLPETRLSPAASGPWATALEAVAARLVRPGGGAAGGVLPMACNCSAHIPKWAMKRLLPRPWRGWRLARVRRLFASHGTYPG